MKKHITVDDLKLLTEAQKKHLFELWNPSQMQACLLAVNNEVIYIDGEDTDMDVYKTEEYRKLGILPLLSIGDCIEIIREFRQYRIYTQGEITNLELFDRNIWANDDYSWLEKYGYGKKELIDTLFMALMDIL